MGFYYRGASLNNPCHEHETPQLDYGIPRLIVHC